MNFFTPEAGEYWRDIIANRDYLILSVITSESNRKTVVYRDDNNNYYNRYLYGFNGFLEPIYDCYGDVETRFTLIEEPDYARFYDRPEPDFIETFTI